MRPSLLPAAKEQLSATKWSDAWEPPPPKPLELFGTSGGEYSGSQPPSNGLFGGWQIISVASICFDTRVCDQISVR